MFTTDAVSPHCPPIENVCAKSVGFQTVMKDFVELVNVVRSRASGHREFKSCPTEIDPQQGDVIYFTQMFFGSVEELS